MVFKVFLFSKMLPFILKDIYITLLSYNEDIFVSFAPSRHTCIPTLHHGNGSCNSGETAAPAAGTVTVAYLKISTVLLHVLLHTLAELQDPAPLRLHRRAVGLPEKTQSLLLSAQQDTPRLLRVKR